MSTPTNPVPAGWFDDQQNPGMLRYWDGQAWTDHRAPRPAPQPQAPVYQAPVERVAAPAQVVVEQRRVYKTSHAFHLIMSIVTIGLWIPVWIVVGLMNAARN